MNQNFYDTLVDSPVIAAVKDFAGIEKCLESDVEIVFVLFGNICNIGEIVDKVKSAGKMALVHIDLIEGLSTQDVVVEYIKTQTKADGIISTRMNLINKAKDLSLITVYRIFVLDSRAFHNMEKQRTQIKADIIEVLPGVMPKVIRKLKGICHQPVIAGGLIGDKDDVMDALEAGAISVSTTNQDVWFL
ncbi:glycerol-3-phosphate responsive antiterminator [Chakrabartyella piscis]|uniref:glycerol-3-phosphate responsive antiterminator n=1 Tax=Chakrabartyella piscis TaxID=2918914 RepID=UPI002958CB57|nr:glycerol-3-phosphate responsive antiterminator [Chakrabartyella piscis]